MKKVIVLLLLIVTHLFQPLTGWNTPFRMQASSEAMEKNAKSGLEIETIEFILSYNKKVQQSIIAKLNPVKQFVLQNTPLPKATLSYIYPNQKIFIKNRAIII